MNRTELKEFLDQKAAFYENRSFIDSDPVMIPHHFDSKEDIEISGFLTATIAWGNRKSILNSASRMMELMDHNPYDFVINHREQDLKALANFKHRTFNGEDLQCFVKALQHLYLKFGGLEAVFKTFADKNELQLAISYFKKEFFSIAHPERSRKHISDPVKNSAAKRINMFLRWMVRSPKGGVDFGIWPSLSPAQLSCPLDVHSGRVARKLKLIRRKQNDAKAVAALDRSLRKLDATDPVKYDYALFGLGVFEKF